GVEPTAPALAPGCCAKFTPEIVKHLCELRVLRRQCAFADTRRVRLHYADDAIHAMRRHAGACAGATRCRIRGSHIWICAVVDIKECSLRAFKQYVLAALHGPVEVNNCVRHIWPQFFAGGKISLVHVSKTDRLCTKRLKDSVVLN